VVALKHSKGSMLCHIGTTAGAASAAAGYIRLHLLTCLALYAALCCASAASSGVSRNTGIGNQLLLKGKLLAAAALFHT
jgi:hypothetical protein